VRNCEVLVFVVKLRRSQSRRSSALSTRSLETTTPQGCPAIKNARLIETIQCMKPRDCEGTLPSQQSRQQLRGWYLRSALEVQVCYTLKMLSAYGEASSLVSLSLQHFSLPNSLRLLPMPRWRSFFGNERKGSDKVRLVNFQAACFRDNERDLQSSAMASFASKSSRRSSLVSASSSGESSAATRMASSKSSSKKSKEVNLIAYRPNEESLNHIRERRS
jgi:hypothetical protein